MISAKRVAQMARKWQRMAALARKKLMPLAVVKETEGSACRTSSVAAKGHFVVYSADGTALFREFLSMSQEDFGFASDDGRITLPYNTIVMEYILCLLRREASKEVEVAFLRSIARPCYYGNGWAKTLGLSHQVAAVSSF